MDATAATGWYGPLIDLSSAPSHVGSFVQLLVFLHRCSPSQRCKAPSEVALQRMDLLVGDDTLSSFSVSARKRYLHSNIVPGDIILLQNVKIMDYKKSQIEAMVVEVSSLRVLVGKIDKMQGDNIPTAQQMGIAIKEKLSRVIDWVLRTRLLLSDIPMSPPGQGLFEKNWISQEDHSPVKCFSVFEVLQSTCSCHANFNACISEVLLLDSLTDDGSKKVELPISKVSCLLVTNAVENLICIGCKVCGSPLISSFMDGNRVIFYCKKSSDHVHVSGPIYKPFLLKVHDQHAQLHILVKNKAAEILFGNISAEKVMKSYKAKQVDQIHVDHGDSSKRRWSPHKVSKTLEVADVDKQQMNTVTEKSAHKQNHPDLYSIWLVLLKSLTNVKNSPFGFEVVINMDEDPMMGKFELVSLTMPCVGVNG